MVKNRTNKHYHRIQLIGISLGTKFHLKLTIMIFLNQIYPKQVFSVENRKIEPHNRIQYILIRVDVTFRLVDNFFDQVCPKRIEKILCFVNNPYILIFNLPGNSL